MSSQSERCDGVIICKIEKKSVQIGASFTSSNEPSNWRGFTCHPDKLFDSVSFKVNCLACNRELRRFIPKISKITKTDCPDCSIVG